jgi:putative glycosyltransferase (TIGR04348 family)
LAIDGDAGKPDDRSGMESEAKTILLVSPALAEANNGNWHTAKRWAKFLSDYCDIAVLKQWPAPAFEAAHLGTPQAMLALHARRSAASIHAWAEAWPAKPLIVVLTGTDLYRDIHHAADAQRSLALATHLVVLQDAGLAELPEAWRSKTRVIYQSAPALKPVRKSSHRFYAIMVGHLREEKDPLNFMRAATHDLCAGLHFEQVGEALAPQFAQAARATEQSTPRYRWLGGLPRAATRQRIKHAHVLVNCSQMEGGAQVILEAVQAGTPVLASRISGNTGMLGADYAGYFALGDAAQLAALLLRCASDADFLALLQRQCQARAHLFEPQEEQRLVINLIETALNP